MKFGLVAVCCYREMDEAFNLQKNANLASNNNKVMLLNFKTGEDLCENEPNRYTRTNIP